MAQEKLIIVGSGPAGLTAALYAARAELKPLIFEGLEPGGQLMGTTEIENYPGIPEHTFGPQLMARMREQVLQFGARNIFENITTVDFSDPENLKLRADEKLYEAQSVIIATGASARWLHLGKDEEKYKGKGYTACATCDGAFFRNKIVAVVGAGDSACEEAHFLTRYASKIYLLVRTEAFRASKLMQKRVMQEPKIEILYNKQVTDLRGEPLLKSIELTDPVTNEKSELLIDGLFMAIGHDPNTSFLEGQLDLLPNKYLKIENYTRTKIPSVFVAGDCADPKYRQAVVAAGFGCMAALDAERYLNEKGNA